MSATRLTFLYPHLLRSARSSGAQVATQQPWAAFYEGATAAWVSRRSVSSRSKSSFAPRHGKAVSPAEWEELQKQHQQDGPQQEQQQQEQQEQPVVAPEEQPQPTAQDIANPASKEQAPESTIRESMTAPEKTTDGVETEIASAAAATSAQPASAASSSETSETEKKAEEETDEEARSRQNRESAKHSGPLEAVMHMQPPEHVAQQHPSMSPPPYVHHFDSYSMVKRLEAGGYTRDQAVTSMKAIRKLLAKHLDVAQQSLVSKSDVENVSIQLP
jgi:hypothetical protein